MEEIRGAFVTLRSAITGLARESAQEVDVERLRHQVSDMVLGVRTVSAHVPQLDYVIERVDPVPGHIARDAYSALSEMLANVLQHSGSQTLEVKLEISDQLALTVSDTGVGFDLEASSVPATSISSLRGNGLHNLRYRAMIHGGTYTHAKRDSGGSVATWCVPLEDS